MTQASISRSQRPEAKLADAWRILGCLGYLDTIFNHISVAWLDNLGELRITMNPDGYLPKEVSSRRMRTFFAAEAGNLDPRKVGVNPDGLRLHAFAHRRRKVPGVVLHTHSPNAVAVGATAQGLLALSQTAMEFVRDLVLIEYTGLFRSFCEHSSFMEICERGGVALLRNHGTLIVTDTVEEAVYIQHFLEEACKIQILTLSQKQALAIPDDEVVAQVAETLQRDRKSEAENLFRAFKRTLLA